VRSTTPEGTRDMRPEIYCTTSWTSRDTMTNPSFIDPSHSRQSSGSTTSDCSPVSPTFSLRGHVRYASSNSSSISLPTPHLPQADYTITYHKSTPALPDVVEDPMERDGSAELKESIQYFGTSSANAKALP